MLADLLMLISCFDMRKNKRGCLILSLVVASAFFCSVLGLRPLRESSQSWGDEWLFTRREEDLGPYSAWNITGTYRGHSGATRTFSAKIGQKGQKGRFREYLLKSVPGQTFSTIAASRRPSTASWPSRRSFESRSTSGPLAREPRLFLAVMGLGLGQRALARSLA